MARPITKKSIVSKVKKTMNELGTYRKEFDQVIEVYSGMLFQYQEYEKQHAEAGYPVTEIYVNNAGAENERKVPIISVMETLRKDILSYSNQLMLNPKALGESFEKDDKESPLKAVFARQPKRGGPHG
ncbi:hypothetical protein BU202_08190 [Streptococcus cuniculi]|uniref:Terminase n=1 Tax=Streptococcus cuniculi TaxID=1432788 RepID=A0A1Q8E676_9STRE|nr:hypothetical protein BU202_08190 [Streptococcus cuniculi]